MPKRWRLFLKQKYLLYHAVVSVECNWDCFADDSVFCRRTGSVAPCERENRIENYKRYRVFHDHEETVLLAILAYTGIVFKRLNPAGFDPDDFAYAQKALWFTCFVTVCCARSIRLRIIVWRRCELPVAADHTLFSYWKDLLTDLFIEEIRQNGGTLAYLASDEMRTVSLG